jgi:murein DD-endopeptidase MepM/ murein hydrolase activator NlpD
MKLSITFALLLPFASLLPISDKQDRPSIFPIEGKTVKDISAGYGMFVHPVLNVKRMHEGVDFKVDDGTPVVATGSGKVIWVGTHQDGFGMSLTIQHAAGISTFYAHLSKFAVKEGSEVVRGQLIAYSGNTGLSTGPHLHYGVFKNGKSVDPKEFFPK